MTPPRVDQKKVKGNDILSLYSNTLCVWTYEKHKVAYTKRAQKCDYVFLQADDLLDEFLAQPLSCLEVACIVFDFDDASAKPSPSPASRELEQNLKMAAVHLAV